MPKKRNSSLSRRLKSTVRARAYHNGRSQIRRNLVGISVEMVNGSLPAETLVEAEEEFVLEIHGDEFFD